MIFIQYFDIKIVNFLAEQNGINSNNYNDLVEFLQTIDAHKFVYDNPDDLYPMGASRKKSDIIWGPTIEGKFIFVIFGQKLIIKKKKQLPQQQIHLLRNIRK